MGLPCLLGLRRKPTTGGKYLLAIPPSASTWGARVRWELAVVQAFGVSYPKSDVERIPAGAFVTDLLYAVAEAREAGNTGTLEALGELLDIYASRMGALLPLLRSAAEASPRPEECLLEKRTEFQPFPSSCSPKFVDELLEFCGVALSDDSFHNIRDLLESSLGMLRLRLVGADKGDAETSAATDEVGYAAEADQPQGDYSGDDSEFESAEEEDPEARDTSVIVVDDDEEDDDDGDEDACDKTTWELLERLLGFRHTFEPTHCPWLLYSVLTPALLEEKEESAWDEPHVPTLKPIAACMINFLAQLQAGAILGCAGDSMDVATDLWPLISGAGGMWLGPDFVGLERCVWASGDGPIWEALAECGCRAGPVVAIEAVLQSEWTKTAAVNEVLSSETRTAFLAAMGRCCLKGSAKRQGSTWAPGMTVPALPHPSNLVRASSICRRV